MRKDVVVVVGGVIVVRGKPNGRERTVTIECIVGHEMRHTDNARIGIDIRLLLLLCRRLETMYNGHVSASFRFQQHVLVNVWHVSGGVPV